MMTGKHVSRLSGYAPALPTPFDQDGDVDGAAFERLCDRQIQEGATALVVCGSAGEAATLSRVEHDRMVRMAIGVAHGRAPVIAGVESLRLLAARGLVGLGVRLLQTVAHAYRAGYLDLRQVECCVGLSRRLRRHACHLIGASARHALPARAPLEFGGASRPEVSGCNTPAILLDVASQIGHSRAKPAILSSRTYSSIDEQLALSHPGGLKAARLIGCIPRR